MEKYNSWDQNVNLVFTRSEIEIKRLTTPNYIDTQAAAHEIHHCHLALRIVPSPTIPFNFSVRLQRTSDEYSLCDIFCIYYKQIYYLCKLKYQIWRNKTHLWFHTRKKGRREQRNTWVPQNTYLKKSKK